MKKRAIIYPYNQLAAQFVRYREHLNDFEITEAVSPPGLSMGGYDAGIADEGIGTGLTVTENFEEALQTCDTVIVSEYPIPQDSMFLGKILENLLFAMKKGKNIHCILSLPDSTVAFLQAQAKHYHIRFTYQGENNIFPGLPLSEEEITTPIVTIMSMSENCSKFETELALYSRLRKKGYHVSLIGSRNGCELFGQYSFPKFMYEPLLEEEKIDRLRSYITYLEKKDNPDVIVLGIPGALLPTDKKHKNHYCILPTEVACAAPSDYTILTVLADQASERNYHMMEKLLLYRYRSSLDAVVISNTRFNQDGLVNNNQAEVGYDILPPKWRELDIRTEDLRHLPFYRVYSPEEMDAMEERMEDSLESNYQNQGLA